LASQVIDEYRDRESCKLNVILHNVPTCTGLSEHIGHDTDAVLDIKSKIGVRPGEVSSIIACLGEKVDHKCD